MYSSKTLTRDFLSFFLSIKAFIMESKRIEIHCLKKQKIYLNCFLFKKSLTMIVLLVV